MASGGELSILGKPLERQRLSETVQDRLSRAIVSGQLVAGHKLTEPELASQLGISRAPIREALIGLECAGLVHSDERGRTMVPVMQREDLEEIYLLRWALEPLAAQQAARHLDAAGLKTLRDNVMQTQRVTTEPELAFLDTEFHHQILIYTRMPRLQQVWQFVRYQIELWLNQMQPLCSHSFDETRQHTVESHLQLIEVLSTQDSTRAFTAMQEHLVIWRRLLDHMCEPSR